MKNDILQLSKICKRVVGNANMQFCLALALTIHIGCFQLIPVGVEHRNRHP